MQVADGRNIRNIGLESRAERTAVQQVPGFDAVLHALGFPYERGSTPLRMSCRR